MPFEIDNFWHKDFSYGSIKTHRELKRVVTISREAESVVEQQELVRAITIAVEDLLSSLHCFPILVDKVEVSIIYDSLWIKPIELFVRLLTIIRV